MINMHKKSSLYVNSLLFVVLLYRVLSSDQSFRDL